MPTVRLDNPLVIGVLAIVSLVGILGASQFFSGLFSDCTDSLFKRTKFLTGGLILSGMGSAYYITLHYPEYDTGKLSSGVIMGLIGLTTGFELLALVSFFTSTCQGSFFNTISMFIGSILFGYVISNGKRRLAMLKRIKNNAAQAREPAQN